MISSRAAAWFRMGAKICNLLLVFAISLLLGWGVYSLYSAKKSADAGFSRELIAYKPDNEENYSFRELLAINEDVVGWITIDDTHIDQPVVQGEDDLEYIDKNALGQSALSGAIFLSAANSADFSDYENLLYGHNMENGAMFGDLKEFLDPDYFASHKTGTLMTLNSVYELEIFGVLQTGASDEMIFSPYLHPEEEKETLLAYFEEVCTFYEKPVHSGKILALSTCADTTNLRTVVLAAVYQE